MMVDGGRDVRGVVPAHGHATGRPTGIPWFAVEYGGDGAGGSCDLPRPRARLCR